MKVAVTTPDRTTFDITYDPKEAPSWKTPFTSMSTAIGPAGEKLLLKVKPPLSGLSNAESLSWTAKEAMHWAALEHQFVLPFRGLYTVENRLRIVAAWPENGMIQSYLEGRTKLEAIRLIFETATAMEYIHDKGIIHGNFTPNSIFVSGEGHALLNGFELSKLAYLEDANDSDDSDDSEDARHKQDAFGMAQYMSPNLFREKPRKTFQSDVYAFGMVVEQVLAGTSAPFPEYEDRTADFYTECLLSGKRPEKPTDVSAEVGAAWDLAERCCDRDPNKRPTMVEVCHNLGALCTSLASD